MDQDSFRKLLASAEGAEGERKSPAKTSQPVFQPRKVKQAKKSEYRDRASERRAGINEYAKVESILGDFQQRTADLNDREAVEEQRRYLGGDKDHTILVKGLDFALLEQTKARAIGSKADDESLEAAYQETQTKPIVPKKRTREDLIRELKDKRAADVVDGGASATPSEAEDVLAKARKMGKFKPIGLPENSSSNEPLKNTKGKEKVEHVKRIKKRRKIQSTTGSPRSHLNHSQQSILAASTTEATLVHPDSAIDITVSHVPEKEIGDVDIFADVGEYQGPDFGEDDDDDDRRDEATPPLAGDDPYIGSSENVPMRQWFKEEESTILPEPSSRPSKSPPPPELDPETHMKSETGQSTRLVPLASSALPSISQFLAMDAQTEAQRKKKAKKEKNRGQKKGKANTNVKLDRDYEKLNSYMGRKEGDHAGT